MTIIKSPKVNIIAGKDNNMMIGFTTVLTRASTNPAQIITHKLLL